MSLYTILEAAERLSVTEGKVKKLLASGELAGVDVSCGSGKRKRWRVSDQAIEDFTTRRTVKQAKQAATTTRRRAIPAHI